MVAALAEEEQGVTAIWEEEVATAEAAEVAVQEAATGVAVAGTVVEEVTQAETMASEAVGY